MATQSGSKQGLPSGKNRLALEKSPYLQQHADNPVDWFPWGNEAIDRARELNRLIFLSVGYSTCHWCHVMERESFSDANIARILNDNFIPIKVDREERPDVDQVYMTFVQATTGGGGWPMSVWLTPSLKPIVGGTYFPPEDAHGRPGFKSVLQRISSEWSRNRERLERQGDAVLEALRSATESTAAEAGAASADAASGSGGPSLSQKELETCIGKCYQQLASAYQTRYGGFSRAPKFPTPVNLGFLLALSELERSWPEATGKGTRSPKSGVGSDRRSQSLEMVAHTLRCMSRGGIHDHIGLGFHRYSVDGEWHVPHFEKMLYDQAQLADTYASASLLCNDEELAKVCDGIIAYVARDLAHPAGGFFSGEDADSLPPPSTTAAHKEAEAHSAAGGEHQQKREGAFYVWNFDELRHALVNSNDADLFAAAYTVEPGGNTNPANDPHGELKGSNVLIMKKALEEVATSAKLSRAELELRLSGMRQRLFELREKRPRPQRDSKIVTAWNALMISGLARAARLLQRKEYEARAVKAADFLLEHLWDASNARLWHVCYAEPDGKITRGYSEQPIEAFDRDWAFLVRAMLDLFDVTRSTRYLRLAFRMQRRFDEQFFDENNGGYFSTTGKDSSVLLRMKEDNDGAEPSSSSVAASNLIRLHRISSLLDPEFLQKNDFELPDSYLKRTDRIVRWSRERLEKIPISMTELSRSLVERVALGSSPRQAIVVGPAGDASVQRLWARMQRSLHVGTLCLLLDPTVAPSGAAAAAEDADWSFWCDSSLFLKGFLEAQLPPGQFRLYLCRNQTCQLPITEADSALRSLDEFLF